MSRADLSWLTAQIDGAAGVHTGTRRLVFCHSFTHQGGCFPLKGLLEE